MQAVDAGRFGGDRELQALVELHSERTVRGALDVIEEADFHWGQGLGAGGTAAAAVQAL
jgi:hypothetical protein